MNDQLIPLDTPCRCAARVDPLRDTAMTHEGATRVLYQPSLAKGFSSALGPSIDGSGTSSSRR